MRISGQKTPPWKTAQQKPGAPGTGRATAGANNAARTPGTGKGEIRAAIVQKEKSHLRFLQRAEQGVAFFTEMKNSIQQMLQSGDFTGLGQSVTLPEATAELMEELSCGLDFERYQAEFFGQQDEAANLAELAKGMLEDIEKALAELTEVVDNTTLEHGFVLSSLHALLQDDARMPTASLQLYLKQKQCPEGAAPAKSSYTQTQLATMVEKQRQQVAALYDDPLKGCYA